jgi:PPOX class probable F420-dependent enzyme
MSGTECCDGFIHQKQLLSIVLFHTSEARRYQPILFVRRKTGKAKNDHTTSRNASGTPHTLPLGFLWDEAQSNFLIYGALEEDRDRRLMYIQRNPKVGLHFNLDLSGADSFILTGEAKVSSDDPSSDQVPAWIAKYQTFFSQMGLTIQQAAMVVPVALRVRPLTMMVSF